MPYHRFSIRSRRQPAAALVALWALCLVSAPAAAADEADPGPESVFRAIEEAWQAGSSEGLAHRVQIDGIRVSLGGGAARVTEYSPSQSVYFFEGLFQNRETRDFRFIRKQDARGGERAHGMAVWRFSTARAGEDREMRLVFLLTRQDDVWRISELNQIAVR